jgi:hypothetical protein
MNAKFAWINNQGVRAASGFELQREDRFTMSYRESDKTIDKTITINIENGFVGGRHGILMSTSALERWDDGETIFLAQRAIILENIREALAFQGLGLGIE